ncbi:LuxR family transcriptional regulator [Jiangella ureilytica]|uniref:LuxR family transcriptional regulator n=1 Tax=Jiangella ureilytica TaxID=2530374 RepID=A0A4V2XWR4_9ACTN|nr:LuxR family transcriptional regulator [Jiangella ureilytica]TDC50295.1 LuxR family transcriptional regulator [Jiangella ureilytica]
MSSQRALIGRDREREVLSALVTDVKAGRGQVLVLRGEAGIGKTALLDQLTDQADGCRLGQAAGVESEFELAFAGLHQLCRPFLSGLDRLPAPQRAALGTTFALRPGPPPDRFVVGLAVLSLLSEAAEEQPLICVVDDAHWLDQASAQTLEFVARRLHAERVALVFATRDTVGSPATFAGLPDLVLGGLSGRDAAALLETTVAGRLDVRVRDRVLAEAHGNPLALIELPLQVSSAALSFGPDAVPALDPTLTGRLEQGFLRRLEALPAESRQLVVLAAAEPVGDVRLLWQAAERLGLGEGALAETGGLLDLQHRVVFRHPLVRSAVYRAASPLSRRAAHGALAEVTDPAEDPDRRAWHRARAAEGPHEAVAAELEESADRALGRGGAAAAAAFLEAAATLTPDPARAARRSLAAARAKVTAGAFGEAQTLLAAAQAGPLREPEQAQVQLLAAQISAYSEHGNTALPLLLAAAARLEASDPSLARETYLDAFAAAMFAGRLAAGSDSGAGFGMGQVAAAMRGLTLPPSPARPDRLLQGIAVLFTDGHAVAAPGLLATVGAFGADELTMDEAVRFAWLAACVACDLWDDGNWDVLTRRHLEATRDIGALSVLPVALTSRVIYDLYSGDLDEAAALVAESHWMADVTGGQNTMLPYGAVCLDAMRGHTAAAERGFGRLLSDIAARGEGVGLNMVGWFQAVSANALGRYDDAQRAARLASGSPLELGPPKFALAELVEAAVGAGDTDTAHSAFEQLTSFTRASGTEAALAVEAGRRALLLAGADAEDAFRESIERLARTTLRVEHARARLRYGEWLRRAGVDRRAEARTQLRSAHDALSSMGVGVFTERARRELAATGEMLRPRPVDTTPADLTHQQAHIARLAADGLTNPEIGAALFLSPRTVEWHLRKVFAKVGVSTRRELRQSLLAARRRG